MTLEECLTLLPEKMPTQLITKEMMEKKFENYRVAEPYTGVPNKMAQCDSRWNSKVAWNSKELIGRQNSLETYSSEVATMCEAIRNTVSRSCGKSVNLEDLEFYANFGSPITDNKQRISIGLTKPQQFHITLIRELLDGQILWSAYIGVGPETSAEAVKCLTDGPRYIAPPMPDDDKEFVYNLKSRKVTL